MPYIAFESGLLPSETRDELIFRLTEVGAKVTGIPAELFLVSIRELPDQNIAVGGKTAERLKHELREGTHDEKGRAP